MLSWVRDATIAYIQVRILRVGAIFWTKILSVNLHQIFAHLYAVGRGTQMAEDGRSVKFLPPSDVYCRSGDESLRIMLI